MKIFRLTDENAIKFHQTDRSNILVYYSIDYNKVKILLPEVNILKDLSNDVLVGSGSPINPATEAKIYLDIDNGLLYTWNGLSWNSLVGGGGSFINNSISLQNNSNFNISGDGLIGSKLYVGSNITLEGNVILPSAQKGTFEVNELGELLYSSNDLNDSRGYVSVDKIVSKNSNYAITKDDDLIDCTGNISIFLPSVASIKNRKFTIKNSGSGVVSLLPFGVQLIDNYSNVGITSGQALTVVSNGVKWIII